MTPAAPPPESCSVVAPAKVNLELRVVGRRADGMHLLRSPTVPVGLCDLVTVARRPGGRVTGGWKGPGIGKGGDLALRAARLVAARAGIRSGMEVRVDKRIPVGAGLGGGSSDAAAALVACNRLFGLRWPLARLAGLGAELGADVPFFVRCRQALMGGVGERLEPLRKPVRGWCALAVPRRRTSTSVVFGLLRKRKNLTFGANEGRIMFSASLPTNDLESLAAELCPEITVAMARLKDSCGEARMSGSGSACFALLPGRREALAAAAAVGSGGIDVAVARVLRGRPLTTGESPSGKAADFGSAIRRFESYLPSQLTEAG